MSTMDDALEQLAERLAGVENALMQERTARLYAEADLQSLRAKVIHVVVNDGCVLKKMADESLKDHLLLQSKRFTICALVRNEIRGVVQAGAAAGSSPILVDALTKGTGKKGKGEGKDPKSKDVKGKGKGWNSKAKDNGAKCEDSNDSAPGLQEPGLQGQPRFYCDRTGHMKSDCQHRADDMRKATAARRPFVDKSTVTILFLTYYITKKTFQ